MEEVKKSISIAELTKWAESEIFKPKKPLAIYLPEAVIHEYKKRIINISK